MTVLNCSDYPDFRVGAARTMLAQRGQNYEHVHIISITQISFSYVQISVSIQIRRS
jgi:hypothetical protein